VARDVLLVEDNPGDARLAQEAFARLTAASHQLHVVSDGAEAMAFLRREGAHRGAPTPDLILLDLNLPKISGYEVLAQIKHDQELPTPRQLLLQKARGVGRVLYHREGHQGFLAKRGRFAFERVMPCADRHPVALTHPHGPPQVRVLLGIQHSQELSARIRLYRCRAPARTMFPTTPGG